MINIKGANVYFADDEIELYNKINKDRKKKCISRSSWFKMIAQMYFDNDFPSTNPVQQPAEPKNTLTIAGIDNFLDSF